MSTAAEIRNVIRQLEQIALQLEGKAPQSAGGHAQSVEGLSAFKEKLRVFQELSTGLDQPFKDAVPIVQKAFHQMEVVILHQAHLKKPAQDQLKQIHKILADNINKLSKLQTSALSYHFKALIEGTQSAFWVLADAPKSHMDGVIEATEFNVFKVKQNKVAEVSKFYDAFVAAIKTLNEFIVGTFNLGLNWNVKGTETVDELLNALNQEKGAGGPPPPPPRMPPPPPPTFAMPVAHDHGEPADRQALFADLNVGEDITKRLKKVDKTKPAEEKPIPVQKQTHLAASVTGAAPKQPKRYLKENWFLVNFSNEHLIEFKDEEIDMKQSLFIENCVNCGVLVKPKVKSIFLQKCEKLELVFESSVSGVDVVGCKRVKITCLSQCPSLMVNNSESVHMTFNSSRQCEIVSSKSMDLNITYQQEDGEFARDYNVPEQFLTVFNEEIGKFVTKALDVQFG